MWWVYFSLPFLIFPAATNAKEDLKALEQGVCSATAPIFAYQDGKKTHSKHSCNRCCTQAEGKERKESRRVTQTCRLFLSSYLSLGETLLYWWRYKCWQGQSMGGKGRVNMRSLPAAVRGFLRPCALPLPPAEPLSGVVPHPWSFEGFEVVLVLPLPPSAGKSSESAIVARKATYCESHLLARPHIKPLYKPTSQEPKNLLQSFLFIFKGLNYLFSRRFNLLLYIF